MIKGYFLNVSNQYNFAMKVKLWITLNEPRVVATRGYGGGTMPPEVGGPGTTVYIATHNLIKAHAKAYRIYINEFKEIQKGNESIHKNICYYTVILLNYI